MRVNRRSNDSPQFRIFSDDQLQELYAAALRLMEETGLDLHHEQARDLLKGKGAWVDGLHVRIPTAMVESAIALAPNSFTVYSWEGDPAKHITIGPNRPHYGPGPTCPYYSDPRTLERRQFKRSDAVDVARVCDALPNIDFVEGLATISDVNPRLADVYEFAEMVAHTGKPIVAWSYALDGCRDIHRMVVAIAGSEEAFIRKPNYIFYCEPLSPLMCNKEAMDKVLYCARHRIPLIFTPCPIGGGTATATGAGEIIQAAAESWLGLVVTQILNPGTPFFMGAVVSIMDMGTMVLAYGAPELSLFQAALTELARYVGLPVWSTAGCSDSKLVDEQAAVESTVSTLFAGLSGADLIHDVGFIESAMTGSLHMVVMTDEIIGMVKRLFRGIEVSPETLALDVIRRVGPGGQFLSDDHTLGRFRSEFWFPRLMDRRRWEPWSAGGKETMGTRVRDRLLEILDSYREPTLPEEAARSLEKLLEEAESRTP